MPRPKEINGFCSHEAKHLFIIESPHDLDLAQLTIWIRKGLGKSHQHYLSEGLRGPKKDRRKPRTSKGDIMRAKWRVEKVGESLAYTDDVDVYRGCITKAKRLG